MLKKIFFLWLAVLLTLVPYGVYYLLFEAPREQYAIIIILILFWIFGFWAVAGPLVSAMKARQIFTALQDIKTKEELLRKLESEESKESIIDFIASDQGIPRFIAKKVYTRCKDKLSQSSQS